MLAPVVTVAMPVLAPVVTAELEAMQELEALQELEAMPGSVPAVTVGPAASMERTEPMAWSSDEAVPVDV